jgi:hypothetical protein
MSFEVEWQTLTCAECGKDITPGQIAALSGEYQGRGRNKYVHVNPPCGQRPTDDFPCSYCDAQVGEPCRDWNGLQRMPHEARYELWRAQ